MGHIVEEPERSVFKREELLNEASELCSKIATTKLSSISTTAKDPVNHPSHYTFGKHEVIDVLEDWGLPFHLSNTIKYLARAGKKDNELQDLKKARWYLDRYIALKEKTK